MPDDYYVSQYSGEEIDALLGSAGAGTVRYDAAQSLTDAQKTQARANIAAAPAGYGLGTGAVMPPNNNLDNAVRNGWYFCEPSFNGAPTGHLYIGYGTVLVIERASDSCTQVYWSESSSNITGSPLNLVRKYNGTTWSPWEWVNPPLILGVEYRTTERFLGKPVYVKAINFGAVSKELNQVSFIPSEYRPIRCYAMLTDRSTTIPWIGTPGTDQSFCSINNGQARIYSTVALPDGAVVFVGYYYKANE